MRLLPAAIALLALTGCARDATRGKPAEPFKAQTTDGKHYSLLDLTLDGPVLVAFFPDDCPSSREVGQYLELIGRAYRENLDVVALYEGSNEKAAAWKTEARVTFPVCEDVDHLIAEKYGYDRGPVLVLVNRRTEVTAEMKQFRLSDWKSFNQRISAETGKPEAKIDFSAAETANLTSCPIPLKR